MSRIKLRKKERRSLYASLPLKKRQTYCNHSEYQLIYTVHIEIENSIMFF